MNSKNKKATEIKFTKSKIKNLDKMGLKIIDFLKNQKLKFNKKYRFELPCQIPFDILKDGRFINLELGAYSYLIKSARIYSDCKIGRFCSIAQGVQIGVHNHPTDRLSTSPYFYCKDWNGWNNNFKNIENFEWTRAVEIGNDVWIGTNVIIKEGVKIGNGVIIGSNAIITKDVPDYAIVINANQILRYRYKPSKFKKPKDWWSYDPITDFKEKLNPKIINF